VNVLDLVRDDLRDFAGYSSARRGAAHGSVWLNANENPWRSPADATELGGDPGLNRYPDPQPARLRAALASLYGARPEQVLIGRGSDEAIDLLVRALCRPQRDGVVVTPPVFGMYAVSARLQGAPLIEVPLRDTEAGFIADLDAIVATALQREARLVFLCSPSNPTGQALTLAQIADAARRLAGRAMVIVDEAYAEYSSIESATSLLDATPNLGVLRTLSKAHALAAARIGVLLAAPELIAVLRNCQAPYPLPAPCVALALAALAPESLQQTRQRSALLRDERERLHAGLTALPGIARVYPSQGNYLLVRFADAELAWQRLLAAGVVVRDMRASPLLHDALRVSIGSADENDAVLSALGAPSPALTPRAASLA
jgi:histidinol-phosphate aminotransferase